MKKPKKHTKYLKKIIESEKDFQAHFTKEKAPMRLCKTELEKTSQQKAPSLHNIACTWTQTNWKSISQYFEQRWCLWYKNKETQIATGWRDINSDQKWQKFKEYNKMYVEQAVMDASFPGFKVEPTDKSHFFAADIHGLRKAS